MIELLILYLLSKKVLTMYGISREIKNDFSALTLPSYGTIKPALNRLENSNCVRTQKTMSKGGRPSTYYSITNTGEEEFVNLLLKNPPDNPIQFLTVARVKLVCAEIIDKKYQKELFKILKLKSESIALDINNLLKKRDLDFHQKMVFDNLLCEYKNFISLLEGLNHACNN